MDLIVTGAPGGVVHELPHGQKVLNLSRHVGKRPLIQAAETRRDRASSSSHGLESRELFGIFKPSIPDRKPGPKRVKQAHFKGKQVSNSVDLRSQTAATPCLLGAKTLRHVFGRVDHRADPLVAVATSTTLAQ